MATQSLATKYRPASFDDVSEQGEIKLILEQQLKTGTTKNAYLFCGGAGTGKTTCARIFANEINKGKGLPIELDAASNNSVDDVRNIIQQARQQSLVSEYKVFILDEVHALSNNAWQAMLKLLEEPPTGAVFIMCTTDPQKIPKTIRSRVERFDFQRISQKGITERLLYILEVEVTGSYHINSQRDPKLMEALDYIAKIADGGMRDAITLLDKCLSYSSELTLENVVKVIGAVEYDQMFELTDAVVNNHPEKMFEIINNIHSAGKDLKLFVKNYSNFVLDVCGYGVLRNFTYIQIPALPTYESALKDLCDTHIERCHTLLKALVSLNSDIKYETAPKALIESTLLLLCYEE